MTVLKCGILQISVVIFICISCCVGLSFGADDMDFRAKVDYSAGIAPTSVAVGDFNFNIDGIPDLAVANAGDNNISIFKAIGDGTFQTAGTYSVGMHPYFVVAGDLNGDGKQDLVVTNSSSNTVSVLISNGNGTFKAAVSYPVGTSPIGVVLGKFHGGNIVDIVVANNGGDTISILQGNGDGTFLAPYTIETGPNPYSLVTGDFDGNNNLDLAVTHSPGNVVSILLGNGDGTFNAAVDYIVDKNSWSVATKDFNGDGILDLAVANIYSDNISILLGNGDGTFKVAVNYATGSSPSSVSSGDFNSDGISDLYVTNFNSNYISILLGNGDGTFQAAVNYPTGVNPFFGALGDFNGDGKTDLVVANFGDNTISIMLDNRGAIAISPSPYDFGNVAINKSKAQVFTIRNVRNADGKDLLVSDIVVTGGDSSLFSIDTGDGTGGTCGSLPRTIAAKTDCTIKVTFTAPAYSIGTVTTTLRVASDDLTAPVKDVALSARDAYTVIATVTGANGTVVCKSPITAGASSVCTIEPAIGYYLATFTDNGTDSISIVSGNSYTISNISADHTITATFTQITYSVSVTIPGANGTVGCTPPSPIATGTSPVCIIMPGIGYRLATFFDNGSDKLGVISGTDYTISNISANHTITATFTPITYIISVAVPGANGTVVCPSPATTGTSPVCTITPSTGYQLATLTDNGSDTLASVNGSSYTINSILANHTITATFSPAIIQYTVTVDVSGANGTVTCPSLAVSGTSPVCTITPDNGYQLATLIDNGSNTLTSVNNNSYTINSILANHTITATFSPVILQYSVTATVSGTNGTIVCPSPAVSGTSPVCIITPDVGYFLTALADNSLDKLASVSSNHYTISAISSNHTIAVTFAAINYDVIATVSGGNGTVVCLPSRVTQGGSSICLIAPANGYRLATLTDNGGDKISAVIGNSYTVSAISADHTITASFIPYDVSVTVPGGNGTVVCPSPVTAAAISTCIITPASGYRLGSFTDNGTDRLLAVGSNLYTISAISANHTIVATFSSVSLRDGIVNPVSGKTAPDISDALAVLRHANGRTALTASQLQHADVAPLGPDGRPLGNSAVDVADAFIILRRALEIGDW